MLKAVPVSTHVLLSVMSLLSLCKCLVTLKKSARAVCDNDSLCDCVSGSLWRALRQTGGTTHKPRPLHPPNPFRRAGLFKTASPPAVSRSDWYSLCSQNCSIVAQPGTLWDNRKSHLNPLPRTQCPSRQLWHECHFSFCPTWIHWGSLRILHYKWLPLLLSLSSVDYLFY